METETYSEMKHRQQNEWNNFPMMFAFSNEQFDEGMKKLGLEPTDTDKIYKFGNSGGYYRKTDSEALKDMIARHESEMDQNIKSDKTGEGFIFDMFNYELANHEYIITRNVTDALSALGLDEDEVNESPALLNGLRLAHNRQLNVQQDNEEMER